MVQDERGLQSQTKARIETINDGFSERLKAFLLSEMTRASAASLEEPIKSIGELQSGQFREMLEVALAKARASLNLEQPELAWIEEVQRTVGDETSKEKIAKIQAVFSQPKGETATEAGKNSQASGVTIKSATPTPRTPATEFTLPDLVIQSGKATEIRETKPGATVQGEQEKLQANRETIARRQLTRQQLARYTATSISLGGGILGIVSGALELHSELVDK